jgi:glycosyltransferase involved in cell wall biosynthesis
MHITIINQFNPFYVPSASANRWLTLIMGLKNQGVQITVYVTGGHQCKAEYEQMSQSNVIAGILFEYFLPLRNETLWQRRFNVYIAEPLKKHLLPQLLLSRLSKSQIVWVDSSSSILALVPKVKAKFPEKKIFCELSEFLDNYLKNSQNALQHKKGKKRQVFFEQNVLNQLDGLALMTDTLIKHYQTLVSNKPRLLHLPMTVDLDRFNIQIEAPKEFCKPYILYVGVMNNAKDGLDVLIKSFHEIYREHPDLKLYLVGPYTHDTPGQLSLIKNLNLEERVFWMKEYSREVIPSIVKNAKLLVLPRPDSKQAQGGFPTKLGEYLASGVPVCATRVGELPNYLEDDKSVFFAEPGSVDSFAEALVRALDNEGFAKQVGLNGRVVAESSFNKDIQAKALFNFLNSL